MSPQTENPVAALAAVVAAAQGLELVQVEVCGASAERLVRVLLDQPGGIGLAECERASRALSSALDAAEAAGEPAISGPYTLEVSSPGLDRPLSRREDFDRFAGQRAKLHTRLPIEGSKHWTGTLQGGCELGVRLQPETRNPELPQGLLVAWDNLASARLAPQWQSPARRAPGRARPSTARPSSPQAR